MDYIVRHCALRRQCPPSLVKRGKQWFLDFPFEENVTLNETDIFAQTIIAVDLGINTSATVSVMRPDGTVTGRHFLKLPGEYDSLEHCVNRIKKAQQHGNRKTPVKARGINDDIAVKTAQFIMGTAAAYGANTIVFEHLDLNGKKHGSKKQKLPYVAEQLCAEHGGRQGPQDGYAHKPCMRMGHQQICIRRKRKSPQGEGRRVPVIQHMQVQKR